MCFGLCSEVIVKMQSCQNPQCRLSAQWHRWLDHRLCRSIVSLRSPYAVPGHATVAEHSIRAEGVSAVLAVGGAVGTKLLQDGLHEGALPAMYFGMAGWTMLQASSSFRGG